MNIKYWFEKGKMWTDTFDWDQAYLAFSKCVDLDKQRQTYYPLLAYTQAMSGNVNETAEFLTRPFLDQLITDLDSYEAILKKDQWVQIFQVISKSSHRYSTFTRLLSEYFTLNSEKKFQLLLNFSPADKIEKYWQHALILDINKNYFQINKDAWRLDIYGINKHYENAVSLFPNYALTYYIESFVVNGLPSYDSTYIEKSIELNSNYYEALYSRAWLYYQDDMYEEAAGDYTSVIENAIETDGALQDALERRAYSFKQIGKVFEAILDYNKIIELYPKNTEVWYLRAHAKRQYKDYQGALEDYRIAIEKDVKNSFFCLVNIGDICMQLEDYIGALENYTAAIAQDEKQPHVYRKRAEVNKKLNRLEAAENDARKSSEIIISNAIKNSDQK